MNTLSEFDREFPAKTCPCGCRGEAALHEAFESGLAGEVWRQRRSPRRPPPPRTPPRAGRRQPPKRRPGPSYRPPSRRPGRAYVHEPYPVAYPEPEPTPEPIQEPGSEHSRWVQDCLNRIFALRLPVNGILDAASRSAIRRLQKQESLPITGIVSPGTEQALQRLCGEGDAPADQEWEGEWGARARAALTRGALARKTSFRYVKDFSGPASECAEALKKAGKTRTEALSIINAQIGVAIAMLRKSAINLKRGSRSSKTKTLFQKIFRVKPEFVPTWLKPTDTIKDRGDVVATRCKRVTDLLASGTLKFFCAINSTNCPDCSNDSSDFACSSWGDESKAPKSSRVVCLGDAFWNDMKAGKTDSLLATLTHEPFHIYYGRYVTEHRSNAGKFGGINCIVQFVFETNSRAAPDRVSERCTSMVVRKEVAGFLS